MGFFDVLRPRKNAASTRAAAILASFALLVTSTLTLVPSATADVGDPQYLQLYKEVSPESATNTPLTPGQEFTYSIRVICSEVFCENATITDTFSQELTSFLVTGVDVAVAGSSVTPQVTWTGSTSQPETIGSNDLEVTFSGAPDGPGLPAGSTVFLNITLKVPENYPVTSTPDTIPNAAEVVADNSNPASDDVNILVAATPNYDVKATKTWSPASQKANPGQTSTINIGAINTSNNPVSTLSISEPATTSGSAPNPSTNPFGITDYVGVEVTSLPPGCTTLTPSFYVEQGGTWLWVAGTADIADPANTVVTLPNGVTAQDVGGIKLQCEDANHQIMPNGELTATVTVEQRDLIRGTTTPVGEAERTVNNTVSAEVTDLLGSGTATDTAKDSFVVTPVQASVRLSKQIMPSPITAGEDSELTLIATNGKEPAETLVISENPLFHATPVIDGKVEFAGFNLIQFPAGATSVTIQYYYDDGSSSTESMSASGVPATGPTPGKTVSGFVVTYQGDLIEANSSATITANLHTTKDAASQTNKTVEYPNTATATVSPPIGADASATANSELEVHYPEVTIDLKKLIRPGGQVEVGDDVLVTLESSSKAVTEGTSINKIVVSDRDNNTDTDFWNAYDFDGIGATQVPAQSVLTLEALVCDPTGQACAWQELEVVTNDTTAMTSFSMTTQEALTVLGIADASLINGVRGTLTPTPGTEFPNTVNFNLNIIAKARGTLKSPSDPVDPNTADDQGEVYRNAATAVVDGAGPGEDPALVTDTDSDTKPSEIVAYPTTNGPQEIRKSWIDGNPIESLSATDNPNDDAGQATSRLRWKVATGAQRAMVQDNAGTPSAASVDTSVFDAFNLVEIKPIRAFTGASPVTTEQINGKYMTFDDVVDVKLFDGTSWVAPATIPNGGWMTADGGFKGYKLNQAEQASTLSVRVEFAPNDARRAGNLPPLPLAGEGVAHSVFRHIDLVWEIRDELRSDPSIVVNSNGAYNLDPDQGVVNNVASLEACFLPDVYPNCGTPDTDDATITIIDAPPAVNVDKSWEKNYLVPMEDAYPEYIYTPPTGSNPEGLPSQIWTIAGHNASLTKATHLQLTDPSLCLENAVPACALSAPGNPFTSVVAANPSSLDLYGEVAIARYFDYEYLDVHITDPSAVNTFASQVYLLEWTGGVASTRSMSLQDFEALSVSALETELADVVGFSVLVVGTDGSSTPNPGQTIAQAKNTIEQSNLVTITARTVLRETERDTGDPNVLSVEEQRLAVTNRVSAQSFDQVNAAGTEAVDLDDTTAYLVGGTFEIIPGKSITPDLIVEPQASQIATVRLTANDGISTISPSYVEMEDHVGSSDFWDRFDLVGVGLVELPSGADTIRIDVHDSSVTAPGEPWKFGARQTLGGAASYPEYAQTLTGAAASVPLENIDGIRIIFGREDGEFFSQAVPTPDWDTAFEFTVRKREYLRSSPTTPIPFDPESSWTNEQRSKMAREDGQQTAWATAADDIAFAPGTRAIGINKEANNGVEMVSPGSTIPYVITVRNTGTGYLDLTEIVDALPQGLQFSGEPGDAPVYSGFAQEPVFTPGIAPHEMRFEWSTGERLAPGAQATISFKLQVMGGDPYVAIRNDVTAATTQNITSCTNLDPNRAEDVVFDQSGNGNECGTWDNVKLRDIPNLLTYKAVKGAIEGGHVKDSSVACRRLSDLSGDSTSAPDFYRGQCIANSQHYYEENGVEYGLDEWQLEVVNAGTRALNQIEVFDSFPAAGDSYLVNGATRESEYRPQIIAAPVFGGRAAGMESTALAEVTTSADACDGTWAALSNTSSTAPPCDSSSATWAAQSSGTAWTDVRAYRVTLDFSASPFLPGERLWLRFKTRNHVGGDGASAVIPVSDQQAINQFGATYREVGKSSKYPIAESIVGVHLMSGTFEVKKVVQGSAAAFAPETFTFEVACSLGGQPLSFAAGPDVVPTATGATVTVNRDDEYTKKISGVPVGSDCTVAESGPVGTFGEAARIGDQVTIKVAQPDPSGVATVETPVAQIAAISNVYNYGHLAVEKRIDSLANTGARFGPFEFTVACAPINGNSFPVEKFKLMGGEKWESSFDALPVGADCVVTESDSGTAFAAKAVSPTNRTVGAVSSLLRLVQSQAGSVPAHQVTVSGSKQGVAFENAFLSGSLEVTKTVSGQSADGLGQGPFTVRAVCSYNGATIFDGSVSLKDGETKAFLTQDGETAVFPADTRCDLTETDAGGASSSEIPGQVTIAGDATPATAKMNSVDVKNLFAVGDAEVAKEFAGKFGWQGETLSFKVAVQCTYQAFGESVNYQWDGEDQLIVELTPGNQHRKTITGLPAGAECAIAQEINPQGATNVALSAPVTVVAEDVVALSVTNTFGADLGILGVDDGANPGLDPNAVGRPLANTGMGSTAGIAALVVFCLGAAMVALRRNAIWSGRHQSQDPQDEFDEDLAHDLGFEDR